MCYHSLAVTVGSSWLPPACEDAGRFCKYPRYNFSVGEGFLDLWQY